MVCVGVDKKKKVNKKDFKCPDCREKDAAARAAGTLIEEKVGNMSSDWVLVSDSKS